MKKAKTPILKNFVRFAFLPVLCLQFLFISCASFALPEPKSDDDTVLLFYTETKFIMSEPLYFYGLRIWVRGVEKPVFIDPLKDIILAPGLKLGNNITEGLSIVPLRTNQWESSSYEKKQEFTIPFTLESRKITIFPLKLVYTVQRNGDSARAWWDPVPINPDDVKKIIGMLEKDPSFPKWALREIK